MNNSICIIGANSKIAQALAKIKESQNFAITLISKSAPKFDIPKGARWLKINLSKQTLASIFSDQIFSQYVCLYRNRSKNNEESFYDTFQLHKQLLDYIGKKNRSSPCSVVLCSSPAALGVAENQSPEYHAIKASIEQLVRYYATSLGKNATRVNAVSPCLYYKNPLFERQQNKNEQFHHLSQFIPLKRMGEAHEVANVVEFLLSDAASYVTGQTIQVDGGLNLRLAETVARQGVTI